MTDDRGIYRIYGLPDGRYKVSIGTAGLGISGNRRKSERHKETFYPGVMDEAAAEWVEIKNGSEVRDVDIKIGVGEKAYMVAGKVVDADTGKALSDFMVTLNQIQKNADGSLSSNTIHWGKANSRGEFKIEGTVSGSYAVYTKETTEPKQYFSETTRFEVNGANVSGIEVKAHRGLTVSGTVFVEGANDPQIMAARSQVMVIASGMRELKASDNGLDAGDSAVARPDSDSSFSLSGLRPGRVRISAQSPSRPSELAFIGVERGGVDVTQGFEIKAGEPVADLRVVLVQANCKLRGEVKVEGGTLVKNQKIQVRAVRINEQESLNSRMTSFYTYLDPNGRFLMEGLIAGEYEVTLTAYVLPAERQGQIDPDGQAEGSVYRTAKQRVRVTNGQETTVTLLIHVKE